ncbi:MAG: HD domain-containing protein [Eubacteriales bacterium]|nr:HD domain-containing protein [Eubacteriales bacterium]
MNTSGNLQDKLPLYGGDILSSDGMQSEKQFMQHGAVSVYEHSIAVTRLALAAAELLQKLRIRVNERALVRGALLHDYFLYDWHVPDKSHRLHGFTHARRALQNAERDFILGEIERDMILTHMFPLNPRPPRYRESVILCLADKLCATRETLSPSRYRKCFFRQMYRHSATTAALASTNTGYPYRH